jgi:hypothetical protein
VPRPQTTVAPRVHASQSSAISRGEENVGHQVCRVAAGVRQPGKRMRLGVVPGVDVHVQAY